MRFTSAAQARRWEAHQNKMSKIRMINRIKVTKAVEVHDLIDETVMVVDSSTDLTKLGTTELSAIETALDFDDVITLGKIIVDPNPKS